MDWHVDRSYFSTDLFAKTMCTVADIIRELFPPIAIATKGWILLLQATGNIQQYTNDDDGDSGPYY